MALVITGPVRETYDSNITDASGGFNTLSQAMLNYPPAARVYSPRQFTFTAECTTTGTETAVIANSIATLAALGVTFPVAGIRNVRVRSYSKTLVAQGGFVDRIFTFRGGATPGAATIVTDGTTIATAFTIQQAISFDGTNFGIPQAAVDGTAGPFITIWSAVTGTITTSAAVNARHRVEIYVEPLVSLAAF